MSDNIPNLPQTPVPPPPSPTIPPQKQELITEGDKENTTTTAPVQYEYSHTISHWGVFSKWLAGVASKSDTRKITPTLGQMILISYIVGILLSILECFLTPEMWYSIFILCIPFSILWIFKYLPLAVRRVHAFGKSYLWVFGITPFLIVLVTSLPILLTVGDAIRYTGSENVEALLGKAVVSLILFVIGQIIVSIYFLYWLLKILFGNSPVDIDEQKQCKANSELRQSSSDNSHRLFKTTLGKWIFAASVFFCSIPLIYQFTPEQTIERTLRFACSPDEKYGTQFHRAAAEGDVRDIKSFIKVFIEVDEKVDIEDEEGFTPLHRAAENGETEIVKLLVEAGADVNKANINGRTPLMSAVCRGCNSSTVSKLIEAGADVNRIVNESGDTLLHEAILSRDTEIVKLLLDANADVNIANNNGETPYYYARYNETIQKLLWEAGALNYNGRTILYDYVEAGDADAVKLFIATKSHTGTVISKALHRAAALGHSEIVKLLIAAGADVNIADGDGETPLYRAAERGHLEIVKLLVEAGADVNIAGEYGRTPLSWAAGSGHTETVKLLIEAGADVNKAAYDGETPLYRAAERGHTEIFKLLLEAGADVNKADKYGRTWLYRAAERGHTEAVKWLIEAGADVNKAANDGETPLYWAAANGHTEISKLLMAAGADVKDVNKADNDGRTPLYRAAARGHTEAVKWLIEAGADVNKAANDGETPLYWAAANGHTEIFKLLLEVGADVKDVNKADNDGRTPLYRAAARGHTETVKLLIEAGADVNKADKDGLTPLYWAIMKGNTEIVKLLVAAGAKM